MNLEAGKRVPLRVEWKPNGGTSGTAKPANNNDAEELTAEDLPF